MGLRVGYLVVFGLALGGTRAWARTPSRVAGRDSSPCASEEVLYFWPRGALWPAALQWTETGRVRILACIPGDLLQPPSSRSLSPHPPTPEMIGELVLPGVEAKEEFREVHLYLTTGDGPLHLGRRNEAPCMGVTPRISPRHSPQMAATARPTVDSCAVSVGELPARGDRGTEWVVSLIIGSEGGVASEARLLIPPAVLQRLNQT